jgi:hypothetical protein
MFRFLLFFLRPRTYFYGAGLFTIGNQLYDMSYFTVQHNQRKAYNLSQRYGQGSYAVITGATSATGRAFIQELSKQGMNLILVDEDKAALDELISQNPGAKGFQFNFSTTENWRDYEALCTQIREVGDVSMLINAIEKFDEGTGIVHE